MYTNMYIYTTSIPPKENVTLVFTQFKESFKGNILLISINDYIAIHHV